MEGIEDLVVIEKILSGDRQAYALLVSRYQDMCFTLAMRVLENREESEEICQDAFLKAFHALASFHRKSKFSTWLYRIVYNTAISHLRKKKMKFVSWEDIPEMGTRLLPQTDPDIPDEEEITPEELEQCIQLLSETERVLISLYYIDDRSVEEISEIVGLSRSNVKVKLFRARKKLLVEMNTLALRKKDLLRLSGCADFPIEGIYFPRPSS